MSKKSLKVTVMMFFLIVALASCTQKLPIFKGSADLGESQTTMAVNMYTYYRVTSTDGIVYEIPIGWKTSERDGNTYHYSDGENYLMVSNVSTERSQYTDMVLTDSCATTLLENLSKYDSFLLQTDCVSDVDGAYCRKIVGSYIDDTKETIIERAVIFTIDGMVYSFDCISYGSTYQNDETFRRIIGSIIVSQQGS